MPGNEHRPVFTYQTRVSVTPEQDKRLREYAVRFGRVERTLYRDMQKGADGKRLKSAYLVRFAITAPWTRGRHVWSFWSKVSRQIRAALRAHVELLPASEAHRRLGVSRRRVLPDIAWCDPARESFPTAVRETWWHKMPSQERQRLTGNSTRDLSPVTPPLLPYTS
jgi:hypothetical protein